MYISYNEKRITEEDRKKHNKKYIETKMKEEKEYFDNMFKKIDKNIKLDENQRKIILTDEKYTMVIAGAGSGKTTTITAKVNYLIEKQKIKDEEIIIISFTNKAVEELKKRINCDFKHNVDIMTFHKFGYKIIKENQKMPPKINNNDDIIKRIIYKKLNKNIKKSNKIQRFIHIIKEKIKNKIITKQNNKINQEEINLYKQYISLYKSKFEGESKNKPTKQKNKKEKKFLKVYELYQEELKQKNLIDFDDIINESNKILKTTKNINFKYKYIIIDEYQDISENRYNLIKNLSKKTNTKIMVVGDDWQCIYSFASSNINQILKIEKTYRNSQQLIDIAGEFIQKNKNQIKKNLKSNKRLEKPITLAIYKEKTTKTKTQNEFKKTLKKTLDYIIEKYGKEKNILILGRYKFDRNEILDNEIIEKNKKENIIIYKKNKEVEIEYLTIHAAKGLGYDNVILVNAKNQKLGFPSKIKTNKIIKNLIIEDKGIKYAEERRLFYVALTRTKNEVIIITPKYNYSKFIKEIKNKCNKKI